MTRYPNLPQAGTEIDADQMRSQLNGLQALITTIATMNAAVVDSAVTLPPGTPALASVSVNGNTLHFAFQIPEGATGAQGPQSEQDEVSPATLNPAISRTNNTKLVNTLGMVVNDPPNQAEVQMIANNVDELILALRC